MDYFFLIIYYIVFEIYGWLKNVIYKYYFEKEMKNDVY